MLVDIKTVHLSRKRRLLYALRGMAWFLLFFRNQDEEETWRENVEDNVSTGMNWLKVAKEGKIDQVELSDEDMHYY